MSLNFVRLCAATFSIVTVASGCGGPANAIGSGTVDISAIDSLTFSPAHVSVVAGMTVRWRNAGTVAHTVTSGLSSKAADSPGALFESQLPAGGTFEFTFTKVGDQPYFCRFHESMGMAGVVTVTAAPSTGGGGYQY
jgi:plastocyanin